MFRKYTVIPEQTFSVSESASTDPETLATLDADCFIVYHGDGYTSDRVISVTLNGETKIGFVYDGMICATFDNGDSFIAVPDRKKVYAAVGDLSSFTPSPGTYTVEVSVTANVDMKMIKAKNAFVYYDYGLCSVGFGEIVNVPRYVADEAISDGLAEAYNLVEPVGTKTIATNGTYDVKIYASAEVNIPTKGIRCGTVHVINNTNYMLNLPKFRFVEKDDGIYFVNHIGDPETVAEGGTCDWNVPLTEDGGMWFAFVVGTTVKGQSLSRLTGTMDVGYFEVLSNFSDGDTVNNRAYAYISSDYENPTLTLAFE